MAFAKLFGTGSDQLLVLMQGSTDCAPELRYFFQPKGLGVCSVARYWLDNPAGWLAARLALDCVCEASARAFIADAQRLAESLRNE